MSERTKQMRARNFDVHYTPTHVATEIINGVSLATDPRIIADFAAGDGELLYAAANRWPNARIIATDIRRSVIARLEKRNRSWAIGKCDFLKVHSRIRCRVLKDLQTTVDLIVLNPPFSCRGNEKWPAELDGKHYRVSMAFAFLLLALRYLSPNGQLIALMPYSSVRAEKDKFAWDKLRVLRRVEIIETYGRGTFSRATAKTVTIRIGPAPTSPMQVTGPLPHSRVNGKPKNRSIVEILRGSIPMHTLRLRKKKQGLPLIHTSDLLDSRVKVNGHRAKSSRIVKGPAVLLPRVGRPMSSKVALYVDKRAITLSDCVVALRCPSKVVAKEVMSRVTTQWDSIATAYEGTCAPYITIRDLSAVLQAIGLDVRYTVPKRVVNISRGKSKHS